MEGGLRSTVLICKPPEEVKGLLCVESPGKVCFLPEKTQCAGEKALFLTSRGRYLPPCSRILSAVLLIEPKLYQVTKKAGWRAQAPVAGARPQGKGAPGVGLPTLSETLGRQADADTSGNMQLDTPESIEFPKALCFMGRLLAGVYFAQREVKGPCLLGFFSLGDTTLHPQQWPGFPKPLSKYFDDLGVQPDPLCS